jgi:hypothetical protein
VVAEDDRARADRDVPARERTDREAPAEVARAPEVDEGCGLHDAELVAAIEEPGHAARLDEAADIERQEHLLRRAEGDHEVTVARVAQVATAVEQRGEADRAARVCRLADLMLELPHEIRVVIEVDDLAERDRAAEAIAAGGDRQAIAEIEAHRELPALLRHARARVGVRGRREGEQCRDG